MPQTELRQVVSSLELHEVASGVAMRALKLMGKLVDEAENASSRTPAVAGMITALATAAAAATGAMMADDD